MVLLLRLLKIKKKSPESSKEMNVGHMSKSQLKSLIVINSFLMPPRRTFFKCDCHIHLVIDYKKKKNKATIIPHSDVRNKAVNY